MYAAEPVIADSRPDPTDPEVYRPVNTRRTLFRVVRGPALPDVFQPVETERAEVVAFRSRDFESLLTTAAAWGFVPKVRR